MNIKLIDLDGCLSNDIWRRKLIVIPETANRGDPAWQNRFHDYHANCLHDDPVNLHEVHRWTGELIVMTGRPVRYAEQTRTWIRRRLGIRPLHILMRNNNDHRPSHELKRTQVEWLLAPNMDYGVQMEHIVEAIDDMQANVEMYRTVYGIPARVVRVGDEEHAHG